MYGGRQGGWVVDSEGNLEYLTASFTNFQEILPFYWSFSGIPGVLEFILLLFYYYSDQEATSIEDSLLCTVAKRRRHDAPHRATGEAPGGQKAVEVREKYGQEPLLWLS